MSADADLEPCAATARYFDGEAGDDEAAALAHLATCARCQRELGDLIGFEVALGRRAGAPALAEVVPGPSVVGRPRPRRWPARVAIGAAAAAALAAAAWMVWPRRGAAPAPALALAPERAIEARLTGGAFAAHRPYAVERAGAGGESISLATLAAVERAGDPSALFAAHLAAGDVRRARALADALPPGPRRDADLAALALVEGDPDAALDAADRALASEPSSTAARWNRALALRELGYAATAGAELALVAAAGEPGWSDEATARAAALASAQADRAATTARFLAAAEAMIDRTGPVLDAAALERHPGLTRGYFLEAVRTATSVDEVRALEPLARALDRAAGADDATAAWTRALAYDYRVRAPVARAYREVLLRRAPLAAVTSLVSSVGADDPALADLRFGALNLAGQLGAELAFARQVAAGDPWLELAVERERARAQVAAGALDGAEATLRTALDGCDDRRYGHRCAQLAFDVATLYGRQGRFVEATEFAEQAVRGLRAAGDSRLEDHALAYLADLERSRGRLAVAAATFVEVAARAEARDCATRRFAQLGGLMIAVERGQAWPADAVPAVDACGQAPSPAEVVAMIERARATGDDDDRGRARAWLTAAALPPPTAAVLTSFVDDGAAAPSAAALRALPSADEEAAEVRAWVYGAAIDRAAAAGAWAEVVTLATDEVAMPAPAPCALVVSRDRATAVAVAIDPRGARAGERGDAALTSPRLRAHLDGCAQVAVVARPPLHGQAGLVPPDRPWSFVRGPSLAAVASPRRLVVGDALPPSALGLPALAPVAVPVDTIALRGGAATPTAVLRALADATYAELHVHGRVDLGRADASFLALSPDGDGRWALTAADLRQVRLAGAPVVVLAACRAAAVAPLRHARWSLPDALLAAGARAVIAPAEDIPDVAAGPVFAAIRARIEAGAAPAVAVAAERAAALARGEAWAASIMVFE